MHDLKSTFGNIDIYLFDQLLKGRLKQGMRVLDAGCGRGRNLVYLLQQGYEVDGVDQDEGAIRYLRAIAKRLAPDVPADRFTIGEVAQLDFEDASFDFVISSAVLHFSKDQHHFHQMVNEMWRVLKPTGILFARLASTIGIEDRVESKGEGWHHLPDGTDRFLVDQDQLLAKTEALGGKLLDPIKTTNVQNLRSMTTWVVQKA